MKRPWRKHFTHIWATDPFVRGLNLEERCVFWELLDIAWDEGGLKTEWIDTGLYVAKRIGCSRRKFMSISPTIRAKFEEISPGIWSNPRLELERKEAEESAEKAANAAKAKWSAHASALPQRSDLAMPSEEEIEKELDKEKKQSRPRKTADRDPLPYSLADLQAELAKSGRYTVVTPNKGQAINAQRLIRRHSLEQLRLIADWLRAGGESWRKTIDIRSLGDLSAWSAHAEKWHSDGRKPIAGAQGQLRAPNVGYAAAPAKHNTETRDVTDEL